MSGSPAGERLTSLDAFRGFAIAGMVLVNNPGDWSNLYSQLAHAPWHGWTFTDWIFPFFLFIVGVSMTFSLARRRAAASDQTAPNQSALLFSLWRRGAVIVLIGLALNFIPQFDLGTIRIPGVLQRIGLCVILTAPIVLYTGWRAQVAWILGLSAVYVLVMLLVPVPDVSGRVAAGVLEPGRDAGAYLDRLLLDGHLWVKSKTWDPEGILSTLPAMTSVLFGVLTGHGLASTATRAEKTIWMLLAGLLLLWVGAMLDVALMPINKNLWTPSFAVFMAGWALVVFAAFYWLIDGCEQAAVRARARRACAFFTIYGMNALFIFAFSGLVGKALAYVKFESAGGTMTLKAWLFAPLKTLPLSPAAQSLSFALLFNLAMFGVAWFMWRRRWFVTV